MTSSIDGSESILRLKTLCLSHSEVKLPKADEHAALLFNGLGARRWQISLQCDSLSFRKALLSIYPRLKTVNGYNLWFVNKEKRFQIIPEKVNNPRRIKNFLSTFNAECLLIIPVTNIQLMEENLEKLEKRNEEFSTNTKYALIKERVEYGTVQLCLICGSNGGGCDGALETVDSVMHESSKIAEKIFSFLGIVDSVKSEPLYRGKKICRRCLIAATELSDMECSSDSESRCTSRDEDSLESTDLSPQNNICQTQPLDFSKSSSDSSSSSSPPNSPPPTNMEYNMNPYGHIDTENVVTGSSLPLPLCNPIYTRKANSITTAPLYPMNNQRGYARSQNTAKGLSNSGISSSSSYSDSNQSRSLKYNHSSRKYSRTVPYTTQQQSVGSATAGFSFGRSLMLPTFAPSRTENEGGNWQPMSARYMELADQQAAVSAQLFLAHKSANLRVPGLYSELFSRQAAAITEHHALSASAGGGRVYRETTSPVSSDEESPRAMDATMYMKPASEEYDDERQLLNRDRKNSTGSGSPDGSYGASSDSMEEEAANEKRKPMKKRKISTTLSTDN